jgi:hypothetical protein
MVDVEEKLHINRDMLKAWNYITKMCRISVATKNKKVKQLKFIWQKPYYTSRPIASCHTYN